MNFSAFKNIVDRASFKYISIAGWGEPLLNNEIFEMISYCTQLQIYTHMNSNGMLLSPENIKKLIESGLSSLAISVDSIDDIEYNNHQFALVKDNIINLIDIKKSQGSRCPEIAIDITMSKLNCPQFLTMIDEAMKLDLNRIFLKPIYSLHNHGLGELDMEDYKNIERKLKKKNIAPAQKLPRITYRGKQYKKQSVWEKIRPANMPFSLPCSLLSNTIYVDSALNVNPCCHLTEVILGNLGRDSLEDSWSKITCKNYKGLLNTRLIEFCNKCYLNTKNIKLLDFC